MFSEFEKCKHPDFDNEQDHVYSTSNTSSRSPACSIPAIELARNIRRNMKQMHRLLTPGDDRDSSLIDLVNHVDALAQQIEAGN